MRIYAAGIAVVLTALTFTPARAQEVLPDFVLPEGLEAKVWASTPKLFNPTNIDVDARGRIWVTEGVNYRETYKKQDALKHPEGDRVVILEDTDGDGVADSSKVFAQDADLICPLGIAVIGDKVIVSCSPHLIVYTDADGDDVPETKEILLTGFGGRDHDHGLHSLVGGLDGKWYFNVGNMGPHDVTDRSGRRLHSGSSYVYGNNGNTGNRKSDDGRVWTGGIALRVDPDGRNLTPLAHNFRNSYEIPIDSFGNLWQSDNDDDGNQACRLAWVMEGGNYGFFSEDGTRMWRTDQRPGQNVQVAHWHSEDPGVMPPGDLTGAGGPTGVVVYEGGLLGDGFVGAIFNCDTGRNRVWMHVPKPSGAGFTFERGELIASTITDDAAGQEARMFRPSDVAIGTDGAVYVSDWYDPTTGGHNIRDKMGGGRIIRIAPKGETTRSPKIDFATTDGQLAALNSPAINVRHVAANRLVEANDVRAIGELQSMAASGNVVRRVRAMWVLSRIPGVADAALERGLKDADERVRASAFRAARGADINGLDRWATVLAKDPSPAVRREVAIALRDVPLEKCRDAIVKLAEGYDGIDRFYLEAFGVACQGKESAVYALLLKKLGDADPLKWSDSFANIAWRLHPSDAIDALALRAASTDLSSASREKALTALAFIRDERSARAVSNLARSGPASLRPMAEWWIAHRVDNDWKDLAAARHHVSPDTDKADPAKLARLEKDRNEFLDENAQKRSRDAAARRLADDPDGAMFLLALAAEGNLPKGFNNVVSDRLHRNGDLAVRAMASEYFPRQAGGGSPLPPIKEMATMKGDVVRGRTVFFGNTAGCAKCHRFGDEGNDVGPDLSAIRTKFGRPELLDSVLNPSAAIAFGYEAWIFKTKGNDVYSGFILADSADNVVLKESSGEQRTIPAKDIVLRRKQTISMMPDNVALGLNAQELMDLVEFLQAGQAKQAR